MRRFLNRLLQTVARSGAAPRAARTAPRARPAVEALEHRAVPAGLTGFFHHPGGVLGRHILDFTVNPLVLPTAPPSGPSVTNLMGENLVLWDATRPNPRSTGSNPDGSLHIDSIQFDPSQNLYTFSGCYFNNWSGHRLQHNVPVTGTYTGPDVVDPNAPHIVRTFHFSVTVGPVTNSLTGQQEVEDIEYLGNVTWNGVHFHTDGVFKDYRHDVNAPSGPSIYDIGATIPTGSIYNLETGIFAM